MRPFDLRIWAVAVCLAVLLPGAPEALAAARRKTPAPAAPKPPAEEPPKAAPAEATAPPPVSPKPAAPDPEDEDGTRFVLELDLFAEKSTMGGEWIVSVSRTDESFDYGSSGFLSATGWLNWTAWNPRFRLGPALRFIGVYSTSGGGNNAFEFGLLLELMARAEYALPLSQRFDLLLGSRLGLPILFPRGDFAAEIARLQRDGVSVWSLPRIGWLVGLSVGLRRQMSPRVFLRGDVNGQIEQIFLFATDQVIEGFIVRKAWSAHIIRFGFSLGLELAL